MSTHTAHGAAITRRSMLGAVGTTVGATVLARPIAAEAAAISPIASSARYIRALGSPDLVCTAPDKAWSDFDNSRIEVTLETTGQPVRLTARVPLDYGGPEGTGVGISFAEDGVDLHRSTERGLAFAQIEAGTIASATLEATTVRLVPAGRHTWTLRVRHENPLRGQEAQRTYCRTRRIAPLEVMVVEL